MYKLYVISWNSLVCVGEHSFLGTLRGQLKTLPSGQVKLAQDLWGRWYVGSSDGALVLANSEQLKRIGELDHEVG